MNKAVRRLASVLTAALAAGPGCGRPAPRAVVLVDLDTLRADRLSIYGNPRPTSPHLDAFARSATRFEWAFAQAPYTLPSQVSILTSLYPQTHGVVRPKDSMGSEAFTLAEAFHAAGWRTAAFVDGGFVAASLGLDQGFESFVEFGQQGLAKSEAPIAEWLRAHSREPFFLFIHTYDTHSPYAPPEPYRARFTAGMAAPTPGFEPTTEALEEVRAARLSPNDLEYARALYDGEVAFVDDWFGRLTRQMEELGLSERAVVAVVSDHGEEFREHGSFLHEKLYATVTRVPMLVRTSGGTSGQVVRAPVETVDLMPTLLELAGLPLPQGIEGRSLAATVRSGAALPPPRAGLAHSYLFGGQRAVVDGDLHLILSIQTGRAELFDYRNDPLEQMDLSATRTADVARLVQALRTRTRALPGRPVVRAITLPDDVKASLRALGYLK
jgi:arylsulfatase A-like enzyme